MTASLQVKKGRPNYFVVLAFKDSIMQKNKTKWVSTDVPVKGNNKRLANEKMKEILIEYENRHEKGVDLGKEVLFTVFINEWLENLRLSIAPTTYESYRLVLDKHIIPHFEPKQIKVKDLASSHIQYYVKTKIKTLSPNTVIKHLRNISKCLDTAIKQKIILFNPVKGIDMPKKIKYTDAKHYNEKEIEKLLDCSKGDPLEIAILLTVFYGLRRSEVLGLKWDCVKIGLKVFFEKLQSPDAESSDFSCFGACLKI